MSATDPTWLADLPAGLASPDGSLPLRTLQQLALHHHRLRRSVALLRRLPLVQGAGSKGAGDALDTEDPPGMSENRGVIPNRNYGWCNGESAGGCVQEQEVAVSTLPQSEAAAASEVASQTGINSTNAATSAEGLARADALLSQQADELRACAASVRHKVLMGVAHTAEELGSTCAGAALSHSLHLASAYGLHSKPTHATTGYVNTLDWVFFSARSLRLCRVASIPPVEELTRHGGIPSAEFPSDHVALVCDLEFCDDRTLV